MEKLPLGNVDGIDKQANRTTAFFPQRSNQLEQAERTAQHENLPTDLPFRREEPFGQGNWPAVQSANDRLPSQSQRKRDPGFQSPLRLQEDEVSRIPCESYFMHPSAAEHSTQERGRFVGTVVQTVPLKRQALQDASVPGGKLAGPVTQTVLTSERHGSQDAFARAAAGLAAALSPRSAAASPFTTAKPPETPCPQVTLAESRRMLGSSEARDMARGGGRETKMQGVFGGGGPEEEASFGNLARAGAGGAGSEGISIGGRDVQGDVPDWDAAMFGENRSFKGLVRTGAQLLDSGPSTGPRQEAEDLAWRGLEPGGPVGGTVQARKVGSEDGQRQMSESYPDQNGGYEQARIEQGLSPGRQGPDLNSERGSFRRGEGGAGLSKRQQLCRDAAQGPVLESKQSPLLNEGREAASRGGQEGELVNRALVEIGAYQEGTRVGDGGRDVNGGWDPKDVWRQQTEMLALMQKQVDLLQALLVKQQTGANHPTDQRRAHPESDTSFWAPNSHLPPQPHRREGPVARRQVAEVGTNTSFAWSIPGNAPNSQRSTPVDTLDGRSAEGLFAGGGKASSSQNDSRSGMRNDGRKSGASEERSAGDKGRGTQWEKAQARRMFCDGPLLGRDSERKNKQAERPSNPLMSDPPLPSPRDRTDAAPGPQKSDGFGSEGVDAGKVTPPLLSGVGKSIGGEPVAYQTSAQETRSSMWANAEAVGDSERASPSGALGGLADDVRAPQVDVIEEERQAWLSSRSTSASSLTLSELSAHSESEEEGGNEQGREGGGGTERGRLKASADEVRALQERGNGRSPIASWQRISQEDFEGQGMQGLENRVNEGLGGGSGGLGQVQGGWESAPWEDSKGRGMGSEADRGKEGLGDSREVLGGHIAAAGCVESSVALEARFRAGDGAQANGRLGPNSDAQNERGRADGRDRINSVEQVDRSSDLRSLNKGVGNGVRKSDWDPGSGTPVLKAHLLDIPQIKYAPLSDDEDSEIEGASRNCPGANGRATRGSLGWRANGNEPQRRTNGGLPHGEVERREDPTQRWKEHAADRSRSDITQDGSTLLVDLSMDSRRYLKQHGLLSRARAPTLNPLEEEGPQAHALDDSLELDAHPSQHDSLWLGAQVTSTTVKAQSELEERGFQGREERSRVLRAAHIEECNSSMFLSSNGVGRSGRGGGQQEWGPGETAQGSTCDAHDRRPGSWRAGGRGLASEASGDLLESVRRKRLPKLK